MILRNRVIKAATSEGRSPDGMVTAFGRTHCVLDPEQRYGATGESPVTASS